MLGCGTSPLPLDLAADSFAVTATDIAPAAITRMSARAAELVRLVVWMACSPGRWQAALCVCVAKQLAAKTETNERVSAARHGHMGRLCLFELLDLAILKPTL